MKKTKKTSYAILALFNKSSFDIKITYMEVALGLGAIFGYVFGDHLYTVGGY